MNKFDYKNLTPFKWFVLENFPFIEADFDALTEWQLFCKLGKEINKIIDSQNVVGTEMEKFSQAFIELKNYVDNYFDNLDVQDEINNKLNEMVQDGTLQEIISAYLNSKAIFGFDNVESMKNATNLIDGSYAKTLGYYSINDGGGALYKIIDDKTLQEDSGSLHALKNGLYAKLIDEDNVNIKKFGAYGNNINDDSQAFINIINYCNQNNKNIYLPIGEYKITTDLPKLNTGITLLGDEKTGTSIKKSTIYDYRTNTTNYLISYQNPLSNQGLGYGNFVKNIGFWQNSNDNSLKCLNVNSGCYNGTIENVSFRNYANAINIEKINSINIEDCSFLFCGSNEADSLLYAIKITSCVDVKLNNCLIEHCRFMLYDDMQGAHSHKYNNCYFELTSSKLVKGESPIFVKNIGETGALFNDCTFVGLSVYDLKSLLNYSLINDVFYLIKLLGQGHIVNNCQFLCGSTGTTSNYGCKFLLTRYSKITNCLFSEPCYEIPSINDYNGDISNNNFYVTIKSDSDSNLYKKSIIYNSLTQCKNNTIKYTNTNNKLIPRLYIWYHKHFIQSNEFEYKNIDAENTTNTVKTFVIKTGSTIYAPINLLINKINSNGCIYNGTILLNGPTHGISEISNTIKGLSSGVTITCSFIDDNTIYIQLSGSAAQISDLKYEIEGLENYQVDIYYNKTINAITNNHIGSQLIISNS